MTHCDELLFKCGMNTLEIQRSGTLSIETYKSPNDTNLHSRNVQY